MKKIILFCILAVAIPSLSMGSVVDIYHLTEVKPNSDIDQKFVDNIDRVSLPFPKDSSFQIGDIPTVRGKYTIYKFINAFEGMGTFGEKIFHRLLVIKTDKNRKIIDAYLHTLEWIDSPSINLYRLTAKGLDLEEGINIRAFGFTNSEKRKINQDAILDNVLESKYQF